VRASREVPVILANRRVPLSPLGITNHYGYKMVNGLCATTYVCNCQLVIEIVEVQVRAQDDWVLELCLQAYVYRQTRHVLMVKYHVLEHVDLGSILTRRFLEGNDSTTRHGRFGGSEATLGCGISGSDLQRDRGHNSHI
jgi:hypothetical protein